MEDNVRIKVIGIQKDMGDDETIELHTTGKWYQKTAKIISSIPTMNW